MRTKKTLLTTLPLFFGVLFAVAQGVTWQINDGRGPFTPMDEDPSAPDIPSLLGMVHGGSGGFQYASIPDPYNEMLWMQQIATDDDGNLDYNVFSEVVGRWMQLDFTYFRTVVNINDPSLPFALTYNRVDDAAIAYVFNDTYPDGIADPSGGIRFLLGPLTTDLSPLLVQGENRIVLVHFDDASFTKSVNITLQADGIACPVYEVEDFGTDACSETNNTGTYQISANCAACGAGTFLYSVDGGETFQEEGFFEGLAGGGLNVVIRNTAFPSCDLVGTASLGIADSEAPEITFCPSDASFTLEAGNCSTLQSYEVTATDDCVEEVSITYQVDGVEIDFPYDFPIGTTQVTALVSDGTNTTSCSFNVNVGSAPPTQEDFELVPFATFIDGANENEVCFRLTEDLQLQSGAVWYQRKLDLNQDFFFKFRMNFGDRAEGITGADGIAFVIQPVSTGEGSSGNGIGYGGIAPSLAVEFDSFENLGTGDPVEDHVALQANGDINHDGENALIDVIEVSELEDGLFHDVEVVWNAVTNTLRVSLDGAELFSYTGDIVTEIFNGDPGAFVGWTSATGASTNEHSVCLDDLSFSNVIDTINVTRIEPCGDDLGTLDLTIGGGVEPYSFIWSNGAMTEDLEAVTAGEYSVTVMDNCGSSRSFDFNLMECLDGNGLIENRTSDESIDRVGLQIQPNPVQAHAHILLDLAKTTEIELTLHSMNGQVLQHVSYQNAEAGQRQRLWDMSSYPKGVYFITLRTADTYQSKRIVLTK